MEDDGMEFDLTIMILKQLYRRVCKKCCKTCKPKDTNIPKAGTTVPFYRFIWGMLSSLGTMLLSIKGKCDFFTDAPVNRTNDIIFINKKMLNCNGTDTQERRNKYKKEEDNVSKNYTAVLDGNVTFTFFSLMFYFALFMFLLIFIAVVIGRCCSWKIAYKLMKLLKYPYKLMAMIIAMFILAYECATFDQVDQNAASTTTFVLNIFSLLFSIGMITRFVIHKTCLRKKKGDQRFDQVQKFTDFLSSCLGYFCSEIANDITKELDKEPEIQNVDDRNETGNNEAEPDSNQRFDLVQECMDCLISCLGYFSPELANEIAKELNKEPKMQNIDGRNDPENNIPMQENENDKYP